MTSSFYEPNPYLTQSLGRVPPQSFPQLQSALQQIAGVPSMISPAATGQLGVNPFQASGFSNPLASGINPLLAANASQWSVNPLLESGIQAGQAQFPGLAALATFAQQHPAWAQYQQIHHPFLANLLQNAYSQWNPSQIAQSAMTAPQTLPLSRVNPLISSIAQERQRDLQLDNMLATINDQSLFPGATEFLIRKAVQGHPIDREFLLGCLINCRQKDFQRAMIVSQILQAKRRSVVPAEAQSLMTPFQQVCANPTAPLNPMSCWSPMSQQCVV